MTRLLRASTVSALALFLAFGLVPTASGQTPNATVENEGGDVRLQTFYNGGLLAPGTFIDDNTENDSIPAEGAGTRMMWYPEKAAFRAGRVGDNKDGTQWDASRVGIYSVAFGVDTKASATGATAMGEETTASLPQATAMGLETTASGFAATAMGDGTTASGNRATAMGIQTTASGIGATAMGFEATASGIAATAMGENTTASGRAATAMGENTTASGFAATAMGDRTTASGSDATAMGSGTTAATSHSLSIGECNSANSGSSGDGTLLAVGNGAYDFGSGSCSPASDALVLKQDGDFGLGPSSPVAHLHVEESVRETGETNLGRHAGVVENTSTDDGADVFALKTALDNPRSVTNFISFLDADEQVGTIQGNGNGGIEITGTSADYAEELPVEDGARKPEAAELVGVRGGEASLDTRRADRVMIASKAPIMTGNATPATTEDDDRRVAVAFVGQVPAKVRGTAKVGDLIVASGENDGTGRAVSPNEYRRSEHGPIAGQAWSKKETTEIGEVTVAVGLGRSGAVADQLEEQRKTNQKQEAQIEDLKKRLAALETGRSPSVVAGWAGSGTGLLLAFLLGGLLGAGLLWRRR